MPSPPRPRVLVTRSRHQASALAEQLHARGAEPILIPTIALSPPQSYDALDQALEAIHAFHWLLFTSANAVPAFAARMRSLQVTISPSHLSGIAAIGPSTAHALAGIGLIPTLIPPQAVAEALAHTLIPHITPGETRILLVRAETARDVLPDLLRAAGAHLTIAPAYRNVIPAESIALLRDLLASSATWPDAITFTSASTATNLVALLEAAGLRLPAEDAGGKIILRASIGPVTSQSLRDLGYPPHLEAPEANIPSLVHALARHLHLQLA